MLVPRVRRFSLSRGLWIEACGSGLWGYASNPGSVFLRIALWDGFGKQTLETFRFEDDIKRKVFSRIPTKYSSRTAPMNFYERLFLRNEVKPSPDRKMIKFLTLIPFLAITIVVSLRSWRFYNLFFFAFVWHSLARWCLWAGKHTKNCQLSRLNTREKRPLLPGKSYRCGRCDCLICYHMN